LKAEFLGSVADNPKAFSDRSPVPEWQTCIQNKKRSASQFSPSINNGSSQSAVLRTFCLIAFWPGFVTKSFATTFWRFQFPRGNCLAPYAMFGQLSKSERMRRAYLHFDHHLRQFGA
jgi:hypothetical protein